MVHRLFLSGEVFVTLSNLAGYAGFRHSRSQHVEFRIPDQTPEVLANRRNFGRLFHAQSGENSRGKLQNVVVNCRAGSFTPKVARTRAEKSRMLW